MKKVMTYIRKTTNKIILILLGVFILVFLLVVGIGIFSVRYVLVPKSVEQSTEKDTLITADDGIKLVASESIAPEANHKWAILVHSYRTSRSFMEPYAKKYQEKGYNTLTPDNRAHGASGGKYIGMGYLDQYDILRWIDYILAKDSEAEIILHGVSMGGAALMMLSGQGNIPKNVKAIVEDCGYTSAKGYLAWKLKQKFGLPAFPVIPIANIAFKISAGYYMEDASAMEGVKKSNVPILFIHGTEDMTVPVEDVYRLYEAATCPKELYIAEGAGHGEALWIDENEYWNQVLSFIGDQ